MRITLILLLSIFLTNVSFAQSNEGKVKEINFLTQKLGLNDRQVAKVTKIITRKYDNYQEIQQFQKSNPKKYAQKLKALYVGTMHSVRMLLSGEQQKEAFRQLQFDARKQKADYVNQYKAEGLAPRAADEKYYQVFFFN